MRISNWIILLACCSLIFVTYLFTIEHFDVKEARDSIQREPTNKTKLNAVTLKKLPGVTQTVSDSALRVNTHKPTANNEKDSDAIQTSKGWRDLDKYSPAIRTLVEHDSGGSLKLRLEAIDLLPSKLSPVDRYALYMFLLDHDRVDDLTPEQEWVLVNDIMKFLRRQSDGAPELGAVLAQVYRNKNENMVIRDYAIQHLGSWFEQYTSNKDVEDVLWEAAKETQGTISGAALLSLSRISRVNQQVKQSEVAQAAFDLASDESASVAARTTALAVASELDHLEVLPLARHLVQNSDSVMIRTVAIGAIGTHGTSSDKLFLEELLNTDAEISRTAVDSAIKRLN